MLDATVVRDGVDARVAEFVQRRKAMKDANRYFYLQPTMGTVNNRVQMADGREMIMLASYSYLGLIGHPRIDRDRHRRGRRSRDGRGRGAASDRDERSPRAPRGAHRRSPSARTRACTRAAT